MNSASKVILSACAGAYLGEGIFGQKGIVPGAAIPILYYAFTKCDREWLNKDQLTSKFKTLIKTIIVSKALQLGLTFAVSLALGFKADQLPGQVVHKKIAKGLASAGMQKLVYYEGAIKAPFMEEIAFRGVLMDGIYTLQKKWNAATVNSKTQKALRIALQAALFCTIHYMPAQGLSNYHIVTQTAVTGCVFGYLMEKTSNLGIPLIYHSAGNFLGYYLMMK